LVSTDEGDAETSTSVPDGVGVVSTVFFELQPKRSSAATLIKTINRAIRFSLRMVFISPGID
jgi:hypothetical protein